MWAPGGNGDGFSIFWVNSLQVQDTHGRCFLINHLDNELHLTPVESVIPLTTSLNHLDEYDARMKLPLSASSNSSGTTSRRSNSAEEVASAAGSTVSAATATAKAIQVQFRKKETEEQVQARLNSFSHLQRQVDDEAWITLKHYNAKVIIYSFF